MQTTIEWTKNGPEHISICGRFAIRMRGKSRRYDVEVIGDGRLNAKDTSIAECKKIAQQWFDGQGICKEEEQPADTQSADILTPEDAQAAYDAAPEVPLAEERVGDIVDYATNGGPDEPWRKAFREGFAPQFSDQGLEALSVALETDDPRLIQGATTSPPPLSCCQDWPVEAVCGTGFTGWQGEGLATVAEVEEYFARVCFKADELLGEPAGCRHFLNWFDATPRDEMRRKLTHEVRLEQARRARARVMGSAERKTTTEGSTDNTMQEAGTVTEGSPPESGGGNEETMTATKTKKTRTKTEKAPTNARATKPQAHANGQANGVLKVDTQEVVRLYQAMGCATAHVWATDDRLQKRVSRLHREVILAMYNEPEDAEDLMLRDKIVDSLNHGKKVVLVKREGERGVEIEPTKPAKTAKAPKAVKEKLRAAKPVKETKPAPVKLSLLNAAYQVLKGSRKPMNRDQIFEEVTRRGLWSSPRGLTPRDTLSHEIYMEIKRKGENSRFVKIDKGLFSVKR